MARSEVPPIKSRPVYLNLAHIRQPIPAIVSILHRISGAGLTVFGIGLLLWGLQASLSSQEEFAALAAWFAKPELSTYAVAAFLFSIAYLVAVIAALFGEETRDRPLLD